MNGKLFFNFKTKLSKNNFQYSKQFSNSQDFYFCLFSVCEIIFLISFCFLLFSPRKKFGNMKLGKEIKKTKIKKEGEGMEKMIVFQPKAIWVFSSGFPNIWKFEGKRRKPEWQAREGERERERKKLEKNIFFIWNNKFDIFPK